MALTPEQTAFIAELDTSVTQVKSIVATMARRLLAQRRSVELRRKDKMYTGTFGKETTDGSSAKQLKSDLDKVDSLIDSIFATGLVDGTRGEIEATLAPLPFEEKLNGESEA